MGTDAPSNSNRRTNPSEDRKRKRKVTRTAKSSNKRRRHDSHSLSSGSDYYSSPSTFSSDSGPRGRNREKEALDRRRHLRSQDGRRHQKKKKKSYRVERGSKKRHDLRSKLGEGNHQKEGRDPRRRRHSSSSSTSRSRSRGTSVGSLDEYSGRSCSTCRGCSRSPRRTKLDRSLRSKGKVIKVHSTARSRSSSRRNKERSGRRPSRGAYRYRSPSRSSCSRCSHEDRSRSQVRGSGSEHHHDERRLAVAEKSHSRYPLSTSTLVRCSTEMEARYCSGKDENRAGIVQSFDDLHTSGSNNDSCDGGGKRDSRTAPLSSLQRAPERKRHDDSSGGTGRNGHGDKAEAGLKREIYSSVVVAGPDDGARWGDRNDSPMPRNTQTRLKSQVSTCGGNSEADELEVLLRQKALENLKKFRARISTNANSAGENKYDSIPIKAHEVTTRESEAAQFHESARPINLPAKQKSYTSLEHYTPPNDGSQLLQLKPISDANVPARASGLVEKSERNNRKLAQQHPGDAVNPESVHDSLFSNFNSCSKEFQAESSGKILEEALSSQNMLDKKNSAKGGDTDIHKKDGNRVDVSASTDTSLHKSASEFEQKTMSVMHGGEVVQGSGVFFLCPCIEWYILLSDGNEGQVQFCLKCFKMVSRC